MAVEYSIDVCNKLRELFQRAQMHRPMRIKRYDAGTELTYEVTSVTNTNKGQVHLVIEKFVGGGFAGQVYKVKVLDIQTSDGPIEGLAPLENPEGGQTKDKGKFLTGLEAGQIYAIKILVPPSSFSRLFRNLLYWVGFQGPFQLQVNPAAARAGSLWQKFIRRAAKNRFGDESAVVDIYATFIDSEIGSCGELREWVDGRTWQLEVDEHLDTLKRWRKQKQVSAERLRSPEYRAKYEFMHKFVELLHDMGAYEFARQYEWSTCKSQPNCLKRQGTKNEQSAGLVAVDFRAGLALLPFLPMSPGDFKLIAKGIMRGSLVQFDKGSVNKLEAFVQEHNNEFADMQNMLEELKESEQVYRNSIPDITHNHVRLLYSRQLWSTMLNSAVTGWKMRNLIDEQHQQKLAGSKALTLLFLIIKMIPLLGGFLLRLWGQPDWRKHYGSMLTSWDYLLRAVKAKICEKVIIWHRAGRVGQEKAIRLAEQLWRFFGHLPLSILPAKLHRFLTDSRYRKDKLTYIFIRPFRLYFNAHLREQWLREMVTEGQKKHMLSNEDADVILSQISEPFIQKYLMCLVVHLFTLPVTQVVSITIAIIYWFTHWGQPNAFAIGLGIIAVFQVVPLSPGSLTRGFYVLYLVIRERNFRDYNIAVFLAFFKYIGYLAFPIQMAYRYPALARFMSAHWATEAVHIVPVFGESGALLEHGVFCLFYNWPLTIRRRIRKRSEIRATIVPRFWHIGLCAIMGAAILGLADFIFLNNIEKLPDLKDIWWIVLVVPFTCGTVVTLGCGGASLGKRIVTAAICGIFMGFIYTIISAILAHNNSIVPDNIFVRCVWRVFIFAILSTIGAVVTELMLSDPDLKN